MREQYLDFLICPRCSGSLNMIVDSRAENNKVESGSLVCESCRETYPIFNYIPRFVKSTYYADSFGPQWKTFARSQLDNENYKESGIRFESEIGWEREMLEGRTIVELGSGAGRFVDVVSKMKPKLAVGIDATDAVDASQENIGSRENVFFIQADIFHLPIKPGFFDFSYSIGVLHHTPSPEKAFNNMVDITAVYGNVGLSLYDISLYRRPNRNNLKVSTMELLWALNLWRAEFFRSVTTRLPNHLLLWYCKTFIPILHYLNKIPFLRYFRYLFPSTCYGHLPVQCSMVDTFDTYATKIVHQYRSKDLFQWFMRRGLSNIQVNNSRAGWVSLVALKGTPKDLKANKRVLMQPLGPGIEGEFLQ